MVRLESSNVDRHMQSLRDLPIKRKLLWVTLATCGSALAMACTALFWFQSANFRKGFVAELQSLGGVVAQNSAAPLAFDDRKSAVEVLSALKVKPHITSAWVFDSQGKLFARFGSDESPDDRLRKQPVGQVTFQQGFAHLGLLIVLQDGAPGRLQLRARFQDQYRQLLTLYGAVLAAVLVGSLVVILIVSSFMQRIITGPLAILADVARNVSEKEEYATRAPEAGRDEVGLLTRTFNQMLDQIQSRDQRLRESQQRFEVAVQGSSDGLWDWDLVSNQVYFSPRWKSMLGYTDGELENRFDTFRSMLHPDDAQRVLDAVQAYLSGSETAYEIEFRVRRKEGGYVWILSRGVALRNELGKPVRFAGSHTDITPRKQAQEKLEQEISERRRTEAQLKESLVKMAAFRAVLDKSFSISITDQNGVITEVNENFVRLSGYSREELLGQNHHIVKSGQHPESFFRQMWQTITQGEIWRGDVQNRAKSGGLYWVDTTVGPLLDGHDERHGYLSVRTDITERKQAEADLAEANQKMVQSSRQAGMADIATSVLHNVGNVLNSVNVSAGLIVDQLRKSRTSSLAKAVELLRQHQDDVGVFLTQDPKGKQLPAFFEAVSTQLAQERTTLAKEMECLQQNIEHIKQIVSMQQAYATVCGVLETLAPHELVEDALRMSSATLAHNNIEIVREFAPVAPVLVDRHKVLQILVNLLSNAKHAMDARPQGRRLLLRITGGQGSRVRIEVTDNGAGIAEENLTRIFNHGFTTKKTGHGFGLHSGANTAKEMGGSLSVRSDGTGTGATFILELPAPQPVQEPKAA